MKFRAFLIVPVLFVFVFVAAGITDDQHRFRSMMQHMDSKVGALLVRRPELVESLGRALDEWLAEERVGNSF